MFIGAPAVVGPLFQHVAGIHNEAAFDARCVDPVAGIVEYLQTANTRLAIKNGDGAKVGVGANPILPFDRVFSGEWPVPVEGSG